MIAEAFRREVGDLIRFQAKVTAIADAHGDLFGTTSRGGANGNSFESGTVFEIVKTATGYASTPTTLVSFNGANGAQPLGSLIADAQGDLFGTTSQGGGANDVGNNDAGTVFEIVKTATGYEALRPPWSALTSTESMVAIRTAA